MKIEVAPDSVLRSMTADARGRFARVVPWVWLVWLVWLFAPLVIPVRDFPHWLWVSLVSLPVFLGTYIGGYLAPRRRVVWFAIAIALLAVATTLYNPFAQTYIMYACAMAAAWSSVRKSALLALALLGAYSAQWLYLGYPWVSLVNAWIMCTIIVGLILTDRIQNFHRAEQRLSHDEIRRLAASAERERIGRDLHDLLGHTLSMVTLKSELAGRLIERDPHAARQEIADVERVAREALSQVRSAVSGMRAAALASEIAAARLLLETAGVRMEYWAVPDNLHANVETCLALVLREAITNIQRHARAGNVEVSFAIESGRVCLRIRDDGRGGVSAHGNGLNGMRERIAACDGSFDLDSPRGHGTRIEVWLPLAPPCVHGAAGAGSGAGSGSGSVEVAPLLHRARSRV